MRIILLGPPGAGKGTQAQLICESFSIPQISTGDILRKTSNDGSDLGDKVLKIMKSGALVPDDVIVEIVKKRIEEADCAQGCLFDGFPRTLGQAQALQDTGVKIDAVVELQVDDADIIERMAGRRVHPGSGRVYHDVYNPPKQSGVDDVTGDALIQRDDDKPETVAHRLSVYHDQTKPLVDFYRGLSDKLGAPFYVQVDGCGDIDEIKLRILTALEALDVVS